MLSLFAWKKEKEKRKGFWFGFLTKALARKDSGEKQKKVWKRVWVDIHKLTNHNQNKMKRQSQILCPSHRPSRGNVAPRSLFRTIFMLFDQQHTVVPMWHHPLTSHPPYVIFFFFNFYFAYKSQNPCIDTLKKIYIYIYINVKFWMISFFFFFF